MPTYTIPLHTLITRYGRDKIGLNGLPGHEDEEPPYPIWNESYRATLNAKIIRRYWNREIGMETSDMFFYALHRKMHEIMPYFNQLYETTQLNFDPLKTVDIATVVDVTGSQTGTQISAGESVGTGTTTGTSESSGTRTNNGTTEGASSSQQISSSFPQNMLDGDRAYADGGAEASAKNTGSSSETENTSGEAQNTENTNQTTNITNNENSELDTTGHTDSRTSGYSGIPAELIVAWRNALINIDVMIIDSLADLFMLLWDVSDDYAWKG